VAYAMKIGGDMSSEQSILVNLSGRGDKDADFIADKLGL
jgi:tryptophan synthase beta chain